MDHSNVFHEALIRIADIARNGPHNMQSWQDVREIASAACEKANQLDRVQLQGEASK